MVHILIIFLSLIFSILFWAFLNDKPLLSLELLKYTYLKINLNLKIFVVCALFGLILSTLTKVFLFIPTFVIAGILIPGVFLRRQRAIQTQLKMDQWIFFIENMASATKAGFTIQESFIQAIKQTENPLRLDLLASLVQINQGDQISKIIYTLKNSIIDPVGQKVIKIVELILVVGANDLSKLLTILSSTTKELRTLVIELKTKQSWVMNGAKVAIMAPWLVLLALWTQDSVRVAYQSFVGQLILSVVAGIGIVSFWLMKKIGTINIFRVNEDQ